MNSSPHLAWFLWGQFLGAAQAWAAVSDAGHTDLVLSKLVPMWALTCLVTIAASLAMNNLLSRIEGAS